MATPRTTALVTGATSGLGFEAAAQLAEAGIPSVIITGRTATKVQEARRKLIERTGSDVYETIAVDLGSTKSVKDATETLRNRGDRIDFLLLNAGMVAGSKPIVTDEGVEITFASSIVGHHQLTMGLLDRNLLSDDADIVIAGSEAARGDLPTFKPTDLAALADRDFGGDSVAAAEALMRGTGVKYKAAVAYADTKVFVAWWAAQLAERIPSGMSVNAVSPGSAPDTDASRNADGFMKHVMLPMFKLAPKRLGMSSPVSEAAARYLEVADYEGVSGEFFASAPKKVTGQIERVTLGHITDKAAQAAGWEAIVKVSGGVDYPVAA